LVLDLAGDGIRPTSGKKGARFDLMGLGRALKTAWVQRDDALLALDRNHNGRIDSGAELFGASTPIAGLPAANGFKALAELDGKKQGGNGNGAIDPGDKMYRELRVWQDTRGDGVSSPEELHPLAEVGIKSISLDYRRTLQTDEFGNDLSLQGSYRRRDGTTAQIIDVLFVVSEY
jgi:hypothetical protein